MHSSKVLRRSQRHRMIAGVVGGIAEYLGIDPTLARVLYIVLSLATAFSGFIVYIICWVVIPEE